MTPTPLFDLPAIPHEHANNIRRFHPTPPSAKPKDLYHDALNRCTVPGLRYVSNDNPREMLIYIDGACSNNGTPQARAGYGIKWSAKHNLSYRLEGDGPETCNRSELRAAIVALGLRRWQGEGFDKVILACDSECVVKGVSEWVRDWERNGWKTARRMEVEDRDLWELLLAALRQHDDWGVLVQFWLIPREENEADPYAKAGTFVEQRREHMDEVMAVEDIARLV